MQTFRGLPIIIEICFARCRGVYQLGISEHRTANIDIGHIELEQAVQQETEVAHFQEAFSLIM
jgi:hypothetical protein